MCQVYVNRMRFALVCISVAATVMLSGCQLTPNLRSVDSIKRLSKQVQHANSIDDIPAIAKQVETTHNHLQADLRTIQILYEELTENVNKYWGKGNRELPSKKKYVKYVNDYQARAIVNFEEGFVRVETIDTQHPKAMLVKAIETTLLTTADPTQNDIFSSEAPVTQGLPFLYPQIKDQDGRIVQYRWRANRYANYLVSHHLQHVKKSGKSIHAVQFKLVDTHTHLRKQKYSQYVLAAAKRYQLDPALIYGIIETESSFNPYAVSRANAYGLMQVVPATAGRDVYNLVHKKNGQPSKQTLFSPAQNIDIGSAYLHLLQSRYLAKIHNNNSKEYAVITAYNGGAGNVLKTFDTNRQTAVKKMNKLPATTVYHKLRYEHPKLESRRYLEKVTLAKQRYQ